VKNDPATSAAESKIFRIFLPLISFIHWNYPSSKYKFV
jgi:hypothetical protein